MGGSSSKQERPRNARPLQETTRDLKYLSDKGIVAAECQNPDGNWTWSYLNLNDCLRRNPFNNISAFKGAGRTLGDSYDWPLINREADGEKQTVELAGHTLKVVVDDDKKGRTELSINLLDHLVNWYGVLEFAAPDEEYGAVAGAIMKFLGGMASTTGASYQPIFSLGMQEQARKEKAAQQAVIQQFWLHRTRVEDGKRVVTGYPSLEAMQKRYDEIDGEKWEWERDNDPKFWVGYEPK